MNKLKYFGIGLVVVILLFGLFVALNNYIYAQKNTSTLQEEVVSKLPDDASKVSSDGVYIVDKAESEINWEAKKRLIDGYVQAGKINLAAGQVEFVDGELLAGTFEIDMDSLTVETFGSDRLQKHLKSEDFFSVENFSTAEFVVNKVTPQLQENLYEVTGDLTIKGITNEVSMLAVFYEVEPGVVSAEGTALVDRTLYDIRFGSGKFFTDLGDNVIDDIFELNFKLTASL